MSRSLQNVVIGMGFSLLPTGRLVFHSSRAAIKVASLDQSFRPFCLLLVGRRSVDAIFSVSRVQISRCSSNVVVVVVVVVVVAVVHTGRSGDRVSTCRTHV